MRIEEILMYFTVSHGLNAIKHLWSCLYKKWVCEAAWSSPTYISKIHPFLPLHPQAKSIITFQVQNCNLETYFISYRRKKCYYVFHKSEQREWQPHCQCHRNWKWHVCQEPRSLSSSFLYYQLWWYEVIQMN